MRVTAGLIKGRRIDCPNRQKGERATRPTTGRVREALFNILAGRLPGSSFLDLFAGTGAVGLEAASRGASPVLMVENNRRILPCLEKNRAAALSALGEGQAAIRVLGMDALRAPARLAGEGARFDVVFADPPYNSAPALFRKIVESVAGQGILADDGLLVIQYHRDLLAGEKTPDPFSGHGCRVVETRAYGSDRLIFLAPERSSP